MPSLAELQRQFGAALLAPRHADASLPADWLAGPLPASVSLRVHRNTVAGACSNALRLSYPAIARALGEQYFDALASEYARQSPPTRPQLDLYGEGFIEHLAQHPQLAAMPWLVELARLDWRMERLAQVPALPEDFGPAMRWQSSQRQVRLAASLLLLHAGLPVDELREAMLAEDAERVRAALAAPAPLAIALWRSAAGVMLRRVSAAAAAWLGSAERASHEPDATVQAELLSASFMRVLVPGAEQ